MQGKSHVLIVPSGPLTGLAFQVLVTDAIDPQSPRPFKEARWLIRDHAISILPFAAALTLLREMPAGSSASEALFGIADPRFEDCADDEPERPAQLAMSDMYRGLSPDPDAGCKLVRLPESRAEVTRAAEGAGEGKRELLFGAEASEHQLKARSEDGSLAQYRVLMFATHGHIAGEISGFAEPGLSLSADTAHGEDGYLSASEISDLKLNADWVILSACNTAAGEQPGAEALSGLASSFFFAGARALLVSHWRVYSDAAVTLTTGTFDAIARRPGTRRAEALRQAMLAMIDGSRVADAHPARWAPFVLIGDGR
ncbi:MAG: CHAT domain-containing protein, partial [Rhizobiaceae bacterium]|nr:CHAT domain-containing protein [Rhizobiaceae bacterium]